jgi:hypothetical protein
MVSIEEIQAAYYMVAATGVLVAAVFYILNLRVSQKNQEISMKNQELSLKAQQQAAETRQAQLFKEFLKTQESYEFTKMFQEVFYDWSWVDFDDFMAKYGKGSLDARTKMTVVFNFFEGLGIMVRRGLISADLVYEFNYNSIIGFWEKYSLVVVGLRRFFSSPQFYEPIEWLYGELKRLQVARGHGFDGAAMK